MYNFCTLFDKNYLSRGLSLLESLTQYSANFKLYVLCLDDDVFNYFSSGNFETVLPIKLVDLEADNSLLSEAKLNRSRVEYYFTLSPCLPLYILKKFPEIPSICSLDSDIYFFAPPDPVFKILDHKSIIITPHKYPERLKSLGFGKFGLYNVSFQVFKNNETGLKCLKDWEKDCIDWCHDIPDEISGRFADQKYLDKWVDTYPGEVHVLDDAVSGLAAWNVDNYTFSVTDDEVYVNGDQRMIFYHFHYFKLLGPSIALNGFGTYKVKTKSDILANKVYKTYWDALDKFNTQLNNKLEHTERYSLKKSKLRLLLMHKTGFFRANGKLYRINFTFFNNIYQITRRIKWPI